ncbi:MAG: HD domain-containing protein [Pseudotabrizicola sp.]|uniref:HD domain-containing protein n=1 Tax=Pseudotabrizicola sp. TaxID=2939647 RepID=UPI0027161C9E|nr:HD domain-containing protein [Pseudotabrizicola sp.]MDO8881715.1 HD domain-containing protein [Pseudotabrizicola sp.]MDP2080412.1 HD domain-containing protein [Pseudotabrizicola sp.]MDZ7573744.1 HD domain-containing protein [Pseudotabrizicola sp.]
MTHLVKNARAELVRLWAGAQDPAHDLGHIDRVWANCQQIMADVPGLDADALQMAVIFHDAVNLPKDAPNRADASSLSARAAADWLTTQGWPAPRIAIVTHAIEAHSFSAAIAPRSDEARVLQDADRLEALGAIGLARMFAVAGAMGGALFDQDDPLAQHRPLNDRAYALDHLEVKLFRIAETMQTPTGRAMAEERAEWMFSFRARLLREIGGAATFF